MEIGYECLEIWDLGAHREFIESAFQQLNTFIYYLINVGIKCQLSITRMGITKQGLFKYYLGF
jgi:hypothetical protein